LSIFLTSIFNLIEEVEVFAQVYLLHRVYCVNSRNVSSQVFLKNSSPILLFLKNQQVHETHPPCVFPVLLDHFCCRDFSLKYVPHVLLLPISTPVPLNTKNCTNNTSIFKVIGNLFLHLFHCVAMNIMLREAYFGIFFLDISIVLPLFFKLFSVCIYCI